MRKIKPLSSDRRGKAMMPGKMGRNLPMIAQQNPYASSNMSRSLSGYKKGGRVRKYAEAGEVDFDRDDSPEAQEVERSYSAAGVTGSKDYLKKTTAPKKAAVRKMDARASGDEAGPFTYDEDSGSGKKTTSVRASSSAPAEDSSDGEGIRTTAKIAGGLGLGAAALAAIMSRGKSIPASIRAVRNSPAYTEARNISKMGPSASQKEGAARVVNTAKKKADEKADNLAKYLAKYEEGRSPQAIARFIRENPNDPNVQRMITAQNRSMKPEMRDMDVGTEIGYKKGGKVAKVAPTRYDRIQDARLQKHGKEPMQIAHKAKKSGNFAKRKFSRR